VFSALYSGNPPFAGQDEYDSRWLKRNATIVVVDFIAMLSAILQLLIRKVLKIKLLKLHF